MICISLTSRTLEALRRDVSAAAPIADLIEIRLDHLPPDADPTSIISARPKPVIATYRRVQDGGLYDGCPVKRISALKAAAAAGADYVDIEEDAVTQLKEVSAKLIVSYHNFTETPQNITELHRKISSTGADIVKIAVMAQSLADNLRVFELLQQSARPTAAFCMGELGIISRIAGGKFGNAITYASLAKGSESAPGQVSAGELHNIYRYHKINPNTDLYGVIANPVAHSMSPAIHNAAFEANGIDAVYLPFKVDEPVSFVNDFKKIGVKGYSVTIPHKETIMPAIDEIDPVAKSIGAVNTVVNRNGRLSAFNTDYIAAAGELEKVTELQGKSALLIGAGGTARAIAFGLKQKGVKITIADIMVEKAQALAREAGCDWADAAKLNAPEADILVNVSPVGMHPNVDKTPIPSEWLHSEMVVFDVVYNPIETRLLREAREAGCRTATGFNMFVSQAVAQFEMWTGTRAPFEVMADVVRRRLTEG